MVLLGILAPAELRVSSSLLVFVEGFESMKHDGLESGNDVNFLLRPLMFCHESLGTLLVSCHVFLYYKD